jgi:UDP-N-acetylglucosamine 4,6-dehydratase
VTSLLATGATGTFGHAFIPAALTSGLFHRIAIYSRDEDKQFRMRRELGDDQRLRWFIGDVRDYDRLEMALEGVECVVHAAALKHVPSGEYNPGEHVRTNVIGAQNLALAARKAGVKKVLAVSTDKAVEPTTLYGATKLCMERLLLASNNIGRTRFSCVRYGNVLGSRGSFLETLKKLQAEGAKTFPLRCAESTRFWMEANDAAEFVLSRLMDMKGGEIFVPKLKSSTALSFARQFLPDAEPIYEPMPPGEKIHECLISANESQHVRIDDLPHFTIVPHGDRNFDTPWSYTSNKQVSRV